MHAIDAPAWGIILDKTNSRWGKSRPWFLWLSVPYATFGVLTFLTPNLGSGAKALYSAATYIVCGILYTGINTPVTSILSALTPNPGERVMLTTYRMIGSKVGGVIGRISGTYSSPVVPIQRDSHMSCILRASKGASHADYYDLRYAWKIGEKSVIETFEDMDDYFFRFGGHSHHAGEYQGYIEYFARCLARGETPTPDAAEGIGTVALMQAMDEAAASGKAMRVAEILERYGLGDLAP
jgi:MFS transporter